MGTAADGIAASGKVADVLSAYTCASSMYIIYL